MTRHDVARATEQHDTTVAEKAGIRLMDKPRYCTDFDVYYSFLRTNQLRHRRRGGARAVLGGHRTPQAMRDSTRSAAATTGGMTSAPPPCSARPPSMCSAAGTVICDGSDVRPGSRRRSPSFFKGFRDRTAGRQPGRATSRPGPAGRLGHHRGAPETGGGLPACVPITRGGPRRPLLTSLVCLHVGGNY
jgi:hypothetical protein